MVDNLSPTDRTKCMSRIRAKGMKPELVVRSVVHRLGYRYRLHRRDLPGVPDLVLPRYNAVIFVNGCFWHWHSDPKCPIANLPKSNQSYWKPKLERTRMRDRDHEVELWAMGWRVLTIWECEIGNLDKVAFRVKEFLNVPDPNSQLT